MLKYDVDFLQSKHIIVEILQCVSEKIRLIGKKELVTVLSVFQTLVKAVVCHGDQRPVSGPSGEFMNVKKIRSD